MQMIDATAVARAPREAVWRLVADVTTWSDWGAWEKTELEREGNPPPDGVGALRRLTRRPVVSREEVTAFDPPGCLTYELRSGLPLRDYRGRIELTEAEQGTEIRWRTQFEPKIPGTGRLYRRFLQRFVADTAQRLAGAAEASGDRPAPE